MPAGIGYPPPMGGMNPQNLQAMAAAGDPRAIAALQQMQAAQGGGAPQGGPPPGGGGMPPMGPAGGMPPMQGAPSMSQAEFSGYGKAQNPDVKARQAAMLQEILKRRAMEEAQGGQPMQ